MQCAQLPTRKQRRLKSRRRHVQHRWSEGLLAARRACTQTSVLSRTTNRLQRTCFAGTLDCVNFETKPPNHSGFMKPRGCRRVVRSEQPMSQTALPPRHCQGLSRREALEWQPPASLTHRKPKTPSEILISCRLPSQCGKLSGPIFAPASR